MRENAVPVIGVGASAGGLEALREMFGGFDGRTGMAFVIVQHLDPTHESLMAQLIERYTTMAVQQIQGGETIEADKVYVIPPGHGLAVRDNQLRLTEFSDPRGLRRPIDDFFESLAEDRRALSSCVILSGTGADGSRGLRAVKELGGIAIAQEPDTARYDGMPMSAIGTGLIDIVAQPQDIVANLRKFFSRRMADESTVEEASEVADHIDELCETLRDAVGHDFSKYKRATLTRRIARRMQVLAIDDAGQYIKRIKSDADECEALFRDLLINVTRFFRDPTEFDALNREVIDKLVRDSRDAEEIRVWVPGCSSGEEAYTLGMMFAEAMRRHDRRPYVNIFATDIDDKMLSIAREAAYPLSALVDIPSDHRNRYTIGSSDYFTIVPQIRDMVRFSVHNLVRDPPFSKINLISCRNLLIYFDDALQKTVLPLFHFALAEGGYLFLGSSEGIGRFEDLFRPIDQVNRIFQRTSVKSRFALDIGKTAAVTPIHRRVNPAAYAAAGGANPLHNQVLQRIAESHAPVSLLVDNEGYLLERWGRTGKFLEFPDRVERNIHVPSLVRPGLREVVGPILRKTIETNARQVSRNVKATTEFGTMLCTVVAEPVGDSGYLLVIRENGPLEPFDEGSYQEFDPGDGQLRFLEDELQDTRHRLRSTVEELETTNEELKSSNEEMMSMNEELQSTNEELTTVNDELKNKVDQVTVAHADLKNFVDTTQLMVLVVDADLRLRSCTEAAQSIFPIGEMHLGWPLADLPTLLAEDNFVELARSAEREGTTSEYRAHSADGKEAFVARVLPYRRMDGRTDGAVLIFTNVTQALALERDLREERERLRLALEVAKIGVWEYEPSTDRTVLDQTERELLDMGDEAGDRMEPILARLPAEDRDRVNAALRKAMDGRQDYDEVFRLPLRAGGERWLHGLGRRVMHGDTRKFIGVTYDVTSERRMLEQRELMIREMNHRVKNLFAVIAAMVSICRREAGSVDELAESLRGRIHALGRSHSLSHNQPDAAGTPLEALIETVTAPSRDGQTIDMTGDPVTIADSQLTSIALILHEWATNSAKYGALSVADGRIAVTWAQRGERLELEWEETGKRDGLTNAEGFGTQLVMATARQLQGAVTGEPTDGGYRRHLDFVLMMPKELAS